MTYQAYPSGDGVYRIKVLNDDKFIECVEDPTQWMKLSALDSSSQKQKWKLAGVSGKPGVYTIISVDNGAGLNYVRITSGPHITYWGYGYPSPTSGAASLNWVINQRTTNGQSYSKINMEGDSNTYFDSNDTSSDKHAVNFYYDQSFSRGPNQCYVFEKLPEATSSALDVVFIQDITGSQQPYINKARDEVQQIMTSLVSTGKVTSGKLRAGVVTFRDHPPQDHSLITASLPLTEDLNAVTAYLGTQVATGGGDGPEAQSDALYDALNASWNDNTTLVAILITDSPPHGIGESEDGFPNGCPAQNEPQTIADQMANSGIVLYVVACEPEFSRYPKARDFYTALTKKTGGTVLPLGDVNGLVDTIKLPLAQSVSLHSVAMAKQSMIRGQPGNFDDIVKKVHAELTSEGAQVDALQVGDYYEDSEASRRNVERWFKGKKLADVRGQIDNVDGWRVKEQYRAGGHPASSLNKEPVSLAHAETIVRMALAKNSK